MYSIITLILVLVTFFFVKKKQPLPEALKKGVIAAFFASGLIYAIYYAFYFCHILPYLNWDFEHIFLTLPISTVTIMSVFLSPEFQFIMYSIIVIILIFATLFFLKEKFPLPEALKKGIIASFFISALIYAIYADIGWTKWLVTDVKNYQGLSTEDKLRKMDDGLYEFALQTKNIVDDGYQIYSSYDYAKRRIQYFLLPLKKSDQAKYIIVIGDNDARYDSSSRIFTSGKTTIVNVEPVLVFAQNAYILKRL